MSRDYPPRGGSHESDSISGSVRGFGDKGSDILEAVERAKGFKLCLRRIWALSSSLSGGARNLPSLIPAPDMFSIPSQKRQHHEHEQCTFDFCEHSRLDFTSVEQHHEDCAGGKNCRRLQFPLDLLDSRVEREGGTAWKLVSDSPDDAPSLIDSKQPYMAVSHVWADGTGAGTWGPGKVNACLYKFFSDMARAFQCQGCWWDTISIPRTDDLRNKALNNMHNNYSDARVTLVHDLYLREWEWIDAETACFAIVMSPWYSRGWTALELAKSHKVKILFKARSDRYVIKDLDVDILAQVSQFSPHSATADAIRTLRRAKIETFGNLSSILSPRDTSKPRDVPIISGLLAGVDVSGGLSQQEIYQRILRKLGKLAQGHLFHNSATMAAPGFSWCPTNILDMPMTKRDSQSDSLDLQENGDLEGTWKVYSTKSVEYSDFVWHGTHALTRVSLKSALGEEKKNQHLLLAETRNKECTRALLVQPMRCEGQPPGIIYCRFVGPVHFRQTLDSRKDGCNGQDLEGEVLRVRITNNDKMQNIETTAWEFVEKMFPKHKAPQKAAANSTNSTQNTSAILDDGDSGWQDMKALLFLSANTKEIQDDLFLDSSKIPSLRQLKSSDGMIMYCTHKHSDNSAVSIEAFFYGHEDFVDTVKEWLGKSLVKTEETIQDKETLNIPRLMHLSVEKDRGIQVDSGEAFATDPDFDGKALQLVVENGEENMALPLVSLLLDSGISCVFNHKVKTDEDQNEMHSGLHLAANKGYLDITREIVKHMKHKLNERGRDGRTALVVATRKCHIDIVQHLLYKGAATNVPDKNKHIPLHYAAINGDEGCIEVLLKHARTQYEKEAKTAASESAGDEEHKGDFKGNPLAEAEIEGDRVSRELARMANLVITNNEGRTALQLASQRGNLGVMRHILDFGAKTLVSISPDISALALAAKNGSVKAVEMLLQDQPQKDQPQKDQPQKDQPQKDEPKKDEPKKDEPKTSQSEKGQLIIWNQDELDAALLSAVMNMSGGNVDHFKEVISRLVLVGARSGPADVDGMTALHWAIKIKDRGETIAKSLIGVLEHGHEHLEKTNGLQRSALVMAAYHGRKDTVTALLGKGADIKSRDSANRTALHWAASKGNVDIAKELAAKDNGAILNDLDARDHTALQLAAQNGSSDKGPEVMKALIQAHADVSRSDQDGRCALMMAAESRGTKVVKMLLGKNCNPLRKDNSGNTALGWAAMKGSEDVVQLILEHSEKTPKDEAVKKAIELAAQAGHLGVSIMLHEKIKDSRLQNSLVSTILFSPAAAASDFGGTEKLMELIKDPDLQNANGQTALMFALQYRKRVLFHRLLELRADPDKSNYQKQTPLVIAAQRGDFRSISDLLRAKANTDIQDYRKYTALHYAAERGDFFIMKVLLTRSKLAMNVNLQDFRGKTALHIALEKFEVSPLETDIDLSLLEEEFVYDLLFPLLESGARLDIKDGEKQTPLHWAVRRNQIGIVKRLLKVKGDTACLDIPDAEGRTPLLLAAEEGYSEIVEALLRSKHSFNPNGRDRKGRTPLLLAAERGDKSSVEALLVKEANPNLADHKFSTALIKAAQNGHHRIVSRLTDYRMRMTNQYGGKHQEVKLDARDDMGRTALMLAAENGHSQIVEDLKNKGAKTSLVDYEGKKAWQRAMDKGHANIVDSLLPTPDTTNQNMTAVNQALLVASRRGWTELVEVLLNHQADATFQHQEEGTALHMAAMGGHSQVANKLLEKGIEIVARDKKKRTALMLATEHGFESIVKLLIAKQEVKDTINDWMGPDALRCAAEKGNTGIVYQLLEAEIDPDSCDFADRTALTLAAANGNQKIVDLLLEKKAAPNIRDNQNRTALHHAAWGGHVGLVRSLLARKADIHATDNGEQGALHLAAERASSGVIELLLTEGANPNAKSTDGQNPLHRAAWGGSHDIVELLLLRGADPSLRDNSGNKPWQVAAEKGFESIVETLLKKEETIRNELISQHEALIFASQKGYVAMAEAFLSKGAEATVIDEHGRTPLHWAAERGDYAMVMLLVKKGGPNMTLDAKDHHEQTPLCLAVQKGRATVVGTLLEKGADPNIVGQQGRTVLHIAAKANNSEIAEILVDHKVDPHVRDILKQKAWLLAAEDGHHNIARLLLEREVDFNPRSQKVEDLFLALVDKGFAPMVGLLLHCGVNKDAADQRGRSAIAIAAKGAHGDVVNILLSAGANLGKPDSNLQTPLLWAAKTGNQRIMKMLLSNIVGSDAVSDEQSKNLLNHTDSKGRTALLIALKNEHHEVAKLLLDESLTHKINLNLSDTTGKTALHFAAETGSDDILQRLLAKGVKRTVQDTLERTPLFLAANCDRQTAVAALLDSDTLEIALKISDCHKRTVLHVVAERGNSKITSMLLERNADQDYLNCPDILKRTALSLAVENGHKEVVELLLKKDARQDLASCDKRTPLSLAVANGDKVIVKALLNHPRADVEAVDGNGRTLLQLAVQSGNKEVTWLVAEQMNQIQGPRKDAMLQRPAKT